MKKLNFALTIALIGFSAFAQEEPTVSKTIITGNADVYYRFNFNNTGDINENNNLTSFTNSHDSFELGMVSLKAIHKFGKASVVADLGFGNRAKEFTYNDGGQEFMIKQLNISYDVTEKFKVTAGAFATHLGFEVVDAVDNKNYSMSYAFTNGPFFNTGVKAQYTAGKFSIMAGITNPTDFKTAAKAGSRQKTIIGQLGYTGETGSMFLNVTAGSVNPGTSNNQQIDLVATKKVGDKLTLGFNGTVSSFDDDVASGSGNWFSVIGYLQYVVAKKASLAYRLEYFGNNDAVKYGNPALPAAPFYPTIANNNFNVVANTLSLNYKEGNFTFIPELRYDMGSKDIFAKSNGNGTKSVASILLATTYNF